MRLAAFLLAFTILVIPATCRSDIVDTGDCRIDSEILMLPECAIRRSADHLYIIKPVVDVAFATTRDELQAALLPGSNGWAWFDRTGLVRVTHVAVMDNWASPFHHGWFASPATASGVSATRRVLW